VIAGYEHSATGGEGPTRSARSEPTGQPAGDSLDRDRRVHAIILKQATLRVPAVLCGVSPMQFFLSQVLARTVAGYLFVDHLLRLRRGLAEGQIVSFSRSLLIWSPSIYKRNASPVRYWLEVAAQVFGLGACLVVMIFGWWRGPA
jgi:hypothetical protein